MWQTIAMVKWISCMKYRTGSGVINLLKCDKQRS